MSLLRSEWSIYCVCFKNIMLTHLHCNLVNLRALIASFDLKEPFKLIDPISSKHPNRSQDNIINSIYHGKIAVLHFCIKFCSFFDIIFKSKI